MSSIKAGDTKAQSSQQVIGDLFERVLMPLAEARSQCGALPCFPLGSDPTRPSYFTRPVTQRMVPGDFAYPGGGTAEGLIDALVAHWMTHGDADLAAMAEPMREAARLLRDEAVEADGTTSVFCYAMF